MKMFKRIGIPLLLFTLFIHNAASHSNGAADDEECLVEGSCTSTPIEVIPDIESSLDCWQLCRENDQCNYYTTFEDAQRCFLFFSCGEVTEVCSDCYIGRVTCVPTKGYRFLVFGGAFALTGVTLYDPKEENEICSLSELPEEMEYWPNGRVLNDTITLCGGGADYCYSLVTSESPPEWQSVYELTNLQYSSAALSYDSRTWTFVKEYYNSVFHVLYPGAQDFEEYDWQGPLDHGGCTVQINRTHAIIAGSANFIYWYEADKPLMTPLVATNEPLYHSERDHSCGLFHNSGKYWFVVSGGYASGTILSETNMLDLETLTWSVAEDLPSPRNEAANLQYGNTMLMVAGYGDSDHFHDVLMFDLESGWTSLRTVIGSNAYHGAMAIFDGQVDQLCSSQLNLFAD